MERSPSGAAIYSFTSMGQAHWVRWRRLRCMQVLQSVQKVVRVESSNPAMLFLMGSYTIGKERLFLEVTSSLQCKSRILAYRLRGFLNRHPGISVRVSDNLDHHCRNETAEQLQDFYELLKRCSFATCKPVTALSLLHCPRNLHEAARCRAPGKHGKQEHGPFTAASIWSLDETNLQPAGRQESVLCRRGSWHAHTAGNANRDSITHLPCISAAGQVLRPLVISKGKHLGAPRFVCKMHLQNTSWERARFVPQVTPACLLERADTT